MTQINLKFIKQYRDRHGKLRYYFRRGGTETRLPGQPGSKEFMAAYEAALEGAAPMDSKPKVEVGSLNALAMAYYQSTDFRGMAKSTQTTYRGIVERLRAEHGSKPVNRMESKHVRRLIEEITDTPAAANNRLKLLRALMKFAVEDGWRPDDPTVGVRKVKHKSAGFHTWTEDEIAQYEAKHAVGTRARLALDLLLYTGCRRGDVVTLGRQNLTGEGTIRIRQEKTDAVVELPVHLALAASLNASVPAGQMLFLITAHGLPFSPTGFYNWFVDSCRAAGLPKGCSPHGLRKAIAVRLAAAGATTHQIAAVTGHTTLKEVERYTREANQRNLARAGIGLLSRGKDNSGTSGV